METKQITLKNGKQYRFHQTFPDFITTQCLYDGKWNRISRSFSSWDEVDEWIKTMDSPQPQQVREFSVPDDYYGRRNFYSGD